MPLTLAESFLVAARTAADLCLDDAVRARWSEESACAGMTVGGLAHHLAGQAAHTVRLLGADPDPGDEPPIPLLAHYRQAAWTRDAHDDEANVRIREEADARAATGYADLAARVAEDLAALPATLEAASDRVPDAVLIPWQGWSLTVHDWLVTRLMEIVVHSDDLAASIDRPTPEFPDDAVREVIALLSGVAVERHGQTAVVRALSRPQRAPSSISAF